MTTETTSINPFGALLQKISSRPGDSHGDGALRQKDHQKQREGAGVRVHIMSYKEPPAEPQPLAKPSKAVRRLAAVTRERVQKAPPPQSRPDPNAGISKSVWLVMLREGGRWKPAEVGLKSAIKEGVHIARVLAGMVKSGQVQRFNVEGRVQGSYGVTAQCRVPNGVTLADLAAAGADPALM